MHFPDQRHNEDILLVIRKHPIVYARLIFIYTVMLVMPVVLLLWVIFSFYNLTQETETIILIFASEYFLFVLAFTLITWLNEEFDMFIITNERLIDITQVSFLQRTVASTPLIHIQDATSDVDGFFATILNYGTVRVETAGASEYTFSMEKAPNPSALARKILDIVRNIHPKNSSLKDE
jgi:hypothetical protein